LVQAGRVGRPHGLDGSFHLTRPLEGALSGDGQVVLRGEPVRISRLAGTAASPIVRLVGYDTREAAEGLRGEPLMVPASSIPLEEDEYWEKDLVGCEVVGVGKVTGLLSLPSCDALQVGSLLIPMVRDAIVSIDLDARRIEINREFLGED
jgi:16S rRNA processing protein RimM